MLDPGGAGAPPCVIVARGTTVPCPEPVEWPVRLDMPKVAMVLLLILLLVWWVYTWKRHSFPEWWEDR